MAVVPAFALMPLRPVVGHTGSAGPAPAVGPVRRQRLAMTQVSRGGPGRGRSSEGPSQGTHEGVDAKDHGTQHGGLVAERPAMPTIETLTARLDVISIVLQELARVLSAPQAAVVAEQIRDRLVPVSSVLAGDADEAALAEAAPVLLALGQK